MEQSSPAAPPADRFGPLIERRDAQDFPFYNGVPVRISGGRWAVVMVSVAVAFVGLTLLPAVLPSSTVLSFLPAVVFTGIPLLALAWAAGGHWTALFRRVGGREVGLMVVFAGLNVVVTFGVGAVVAFTVGVNSNPMSQVLADASAAEVIAFYPRTAIQLLGEELLTILPFLALLWLLTTKAGWPRRRAVVAAWVITAVMFGLLHLPTYQWNIVQAVLIIGTARMILTLAYIRTKNLWVSTGAHVLNDWTLFTLPLVLAVITA